MTQPATNPTDWQAIWHVVRGVVEVVYFLSVTIAAWLGLRQLTLTKNLADAAVKELTLTQKLADSNSRREAVKLAAIQCKYLGEEMVPVFATLVEKHVKEGLTFMATVAGQPPAFLVKNGELVQANYNIQALAIQVMKVDKEVVKYLNMAESFAIPFAAGVAADDIGFQETAATFCMEITACMPAIYYIRQTQNVRYASVLRLYEIWSNRLTALAIAPLLPNMQAVVAAAQSQKIPQI
jgi:hypothetical protein